MNIFEKTLKDEQALFTELGENEYIHFITYTKVVQAAFLQQHGIMEKYKLFLSEFKKRAGKI